MFPDITSVIPVLFKIKPRISVYIDGANFVYGLKTLHPKYSDYHLDFKNFIKRMVGKNRLANILYYNASLKQAVNPRRFKEQQKLLPRLRKMAKCRRYKGFNKDDEEYYAVKGDDISLALDVPILVDQKKRCFTYVPKPFSENL